MSQSGEAYELVQKRKPTEDQVLRIIKQILGPKSDARNRRIQVRQIVGAFYEMAFDSKQDIDPMLHLARGSRCAS